MVATWSLSAASNAVDELYRLLSADERRRADAFTHSPARRRFVVGRGSLRLWLAERLGVAAGEVRFEYGPNGKPRLGDAPLEFNLAHSGDLALCAASGHAVGVDLEQLRPRKSADALAERWFHPDETARVRAAEDPLAEFYRTWTAKEAALKLVGLGVGESLPKIRTPDDPRGGLATGLPTNELGWAECRVAPLAVAGFAAAIALPAKP
ncbi:4'-phosphopantetheinyl transferase superfamily protein [Botrimarina sp.]|uniref:4'-phosphopantetheinyl transferase family protein n=1 Tax=Botrimarina sp. TaxID=2795802 RepID=UPI0032EDFFFC